MDANVFGRSKRMYGAVGAGLVLLAAAAGCSRVRGDASVAAVEPAALVDSTSGVAGGLAELQQGLPTGHPAVWYTERLEELDYRVTSLSYDSDGVAVYRVVKAAGSFDVRIALDERAGTARGVEISPLAGAAIDAAGTAEAGAAETGIAESETVVAGTADAGADAPVASEARQASSSAASGNARSAPRPEPVEDTRAPESDTVPRADGTRAPAADAGPRDAETRAPEVGGEARGEPREAEVDTAPPASEPAVDWSSPPPPPSRYVVTVPAGSRIATRLDGRLSSADAAAGDSFSMTLRDAVRVDGVEVLPAGARVWGRVVEVEGARRPNKGGRIVLAADAVQIGNDEYPLDGLVTSEGEGLQGRDSTHEDVKEVAVGAGLGGLLGGLLGGKKGVLIGVLAGGGGTFVATKGEEVELAESTDLVVELQRDLEVTFIGPS